jgi:23S rRNA pseudouridine955/2504/2580 synthase
MKTKPLHRLQDIILFEDDHIVLANKPVGTASLDDKSQRNLNELARSYHPELRLCHRLDKNTSGVLLMAKGLEVYRTMAMQFEHREVQKTYLTLVAGIHRFEAKVIDLPLLVSTNKKVSVSHKHGKPAETVVDTEEVFRHYTLLRCQPVTGRMHQIRIHLAETGTPVVGDALYGGQDILLSDLKRHYKMSTRKDEQPLNHGYLLHAHKLRFTHPASGEPMETEAPLPANFEATLKVLRKYDQ